MYPSSQSICRASVILFWQSCKCLTVQLTVGQGGLHKTSRWGFKKCANAPPQDNTKIAFFTPKWCSILNAIRTHFDMKGVHSASVWKCKFFTSLPRGFCIHCWRRSFEGFLGTRTMRRCFVEWENRKKNSDIYLPTNTDEKYGAIYAGIEKLEVIYRLTRLCSSFCLRSFRSFLGKTWNMSKLIDYWFEYRWDRTI